jgi:hypothetical protein
MTKSYELVPFHDAQVLTIREGERVSVPLKPLVEGTGLHWRGQRERLMRHPVLAKGVRMIRTPSEGGEQEMLCLDLKLIPGFLATIRTDRIIDPQIRARVELFQEEAFEALFVHFFGPIRTVEAKRPTIAEFLRVGAALKKERNPALRAALWADLDRITDAWGQAPVARAIGYADPDHTERLEEFWTAIKGLEEAGMAINQSRGNALIALHLPQIRRIFAEVGMEIDIDRALTEALRHSKSPRFIGFKAVNCKDEMFRKCWVFSAVPSDEAASSPT